MGTQGVFRQNPLRWVFTHCTLCALSASRTFTLFHSFHSLPHITRPLRVRIRGTVHSVFFYTTVVETLRSTEHKKARSPKWVWMYKQSVEWDYTNIHRAKHFSLWMRMITDLDSIRFFYFERYAASQSAKYMHASFRPQLTRVNPPHTRFMDIKLMINTVSRQSSTRPPSIGFSSPYGGGEGVLTTTSTYESKRSQYQVQSTRDTI